MKTLWETSTREAVLEALKELGKTLLVCGLQVTLAWIAYELICYYAR